MGLLTNREAQTTLLSKICHPYPTTMKLSIVILYLKDKKKHINHLAHPLNFADVSIFSLEINNFCYSKKYGNRLHFNTEFIILLTCFEFVKFVLIKMVAVLIIWAKLAVIGLFKVYLFWNKYYDVIIFVYGFARKNYLVTPITL